MELNVKLLERLAGTSLAVVPRVMERIWQSMLEEDGNGELWERLETLDRKKRSELSSTTIKAGNSMS